MSHRKRNPVRDRLRVATAIAAQLNAPRPMPSADLPTSTWRQAEQFARQRDRAAARGWRRAAARRHDDLRSLLTRHRSEIDGVIRRLSPEPELRATVSALEIVNDLVAAEREFDVVTLSPRESQVAVVTDSISLDGVYLGPFEIRLHYDNVNDRTAHDRTWAFRYVVVAQEPNRAGADDCVTHPHVNDDQLCEGDAGLPIRRALAEGRVLDFLLIVRQALETYNSESAYVRLDEWDGGVLCRDCGLATCEDDRGFCERCEADLCGDCMYGCGSCGEANCDACIGVCAACSENHCASCLAACSNCQEATCKACLEDELCPSCHDAESDSYEPVSPDGVEERDTASTEVPLSGRHHLRNAETTGAAVHAVRLGEAAVSA